MSRIETLKEVLHQLQSGTPEIEGAALISEDGLMIVSSLPGHIDELRVAGMTATLLALGQRASHELERGELSEVLVRGEEGYGVMLCASGGTQLLILASTKAKLGLVFLDMRRAVERIKEII